MKVMILAAGRGERMRPLTDVCPKPMLTINDVPLIEYHLKKLAVAGFNEVVINTAWLGNQIEDYCGDGALWQLNIVYSSEHEGALETAGGIINALPLLINQEDTNAPFLVVNADVFTDFDFKNLPNLKEDCLAHLFLVNNPSHNLKGDFSVSDNKAKSSLLKNIAVEDNQATYTFSGIALYRPGFFNCRVECNSDNVSGIHNINNNQNIVLPLAPLLRNAAEKGKINASLLNSEWADVGTPERLKQLALTNKQTKIDK